jgi:hypothetical protein
VEGDGDHYIYRIFQGKSLEDRLQQITKYPHEWENTPVFESMDRLLERPLIEGAGAMDFKIPPFLQTQGAEMSFPGGIREAAARTVGGTYKPDRLVTIRTNNEVLPCTADKRLTDGAHRGKDEVQKPSGGSEKPHLKIPGH